MKKFIAAAVTAMAAVGLLAVGHRYAAQSDPDVLRLLDGSNGNDWAAYGGTFGEQHYSPLSQINDGNVAKLGLAWSIDLPPANSVAEPLEVGGTLYYTNGYSLVSAVDAATGKPLWTYDPRTVEKAGHKLGLGWGARGLAWWKGHIYIGTQDGRLIAIDAKTGREVWSRMTVSPNDWNYITGAPRVFDGKVIIGFGGADFGRSRGYVSTYDAISGKLLWRWYTVPGNPAVDKDETTRIAARTWAGEWWKYGGGGAAWNAMTYDPETNTIFIGTGNGTPWNHKARSEGKGDNLFLCSIVALDAGTGKYKWHYQFNPGESWDYNAVMDMPLATLTIDGKPRQVIMQAPKNGFFYVLDRTTGKLISAKPFAKVTWAPRIDAATGRPVENPLARYPDGSTFVMWPSPVGAHSWYPMALSARTRLVYIPVIEKAAAFTDFGVKDNAWEKLSPPGTGQTAAMLTFVKSSDPLSNTSRLDAWDPVQQKRVWSQPTAGNQSGGVVATGGNLVFQGQLNGQFSAYSADKGKLLWTFDAKAPVLAPPITYWAAGRQYVSVQTGMGSAGAFYGEELARFGIDYRTQARRILTFAIGVRGKLPPKITVTVGPMDDPDYRADEPMAGRGAMLFGGHCIECHGINAVSGGAAPDLRASMIPLSPQGFTSVVNGALLQNGMPGFNMLSASDIEDIRQYIRSRAADWRAQELARISHQSR